MLLLRRSSLATGQVPDQFDLLIHADVTSALEPLEITDEWAAPLAETRGDFPETWPFGV